MEDRGVRGVQLVRAVHAAGAHDVDGRLAVQHGAGLHRRGVGAQHDTGLVALGAFGALDEEGVLHLPGRVVRGEVQGVEVEPLRLDLGALGDLVPHGHEDVGDTLHERGERVPGAGRDAVVRQGDVHRLLDQDTGVTLGLQLAEASGEGLVDGAPGLADELAGRGLGLRGQRADLAVGEGQRGCRRCARPWPPGARRGRRRRRRRRAPRPACARSLPVSRPRPLQGRTTYSVPTSLPVLPVGWRMVPVPTRLGDASASLKRGRKGAKGRV